MMKGVLKVMAIILIILFVTLTVLNFISVDSMGWGRRWIGTKDIDGECAGEPLNC